MLEVKKFYFNPLRVCTAIIWDETLEAVIVDPGCVSESERQRVVSFVENNSLKPVKILLTHGHFDHILGLEYLADKWKLDTYMNTADKALFAALPEYCKMMDLPQTGIPESFVHIEDGSQVTFGNSHLKVIYTPGHTSGGVCYYNEESKLLLSGDTLFEGSIGRTDLPSGDYDLLMKSIMTRILPLGDDIEVIPGHGYPTTIGDERLKNPFLQPF